MPDRRGRTQVNRDFEDLGGRDPHELLGVPPGASAAEINRRFRQRLRGSHPDLGGSHDQQVALNLARGILLDPVRLREYQQRIQKADSEPAEDDPLEETPPYEDLFQWESGVGPSTADAYRAATPPPSCAPYVRPEVIIEPTLADLYSRPAQGAPYLGWYQPVFPPYPQPDSTARRSWSVLAFAALLLSPCFPISLILGLVALNRIHRLHQRGSVFAWLAIASQVLLVLLFCVEVFIGVSRMNQGPVPDVSGSAHSTR
jgi:hypothetical protein